MTPDEAELWRQLAHSIDKVRTKPRVTARSGEPDAPAPGAPATPPTPKRGPAAERRVAAHTRQMPPQAKNWAARPAEFDRRTLRQVAAGKVRIDARLDLHGLQQEAAHARLRAFLASCQANGHRMVLVITGKGGGRRGEAAGSASPRGVLRRSVPQWLDEPEFRAIVAGYAAAGVRHGGEGALYIRLRKAREA
jgi:DNA-nicking Smr family endonuclease